MTDAKYDDLDTVPMGAPDRRTAHEHELDDALQRIAAAAHERMRAVLRKQDRIHVRLKSVAHPD